MIQIVVPGYLFFYRKLRRSKALAAPMNNNSVQEEDDNGEDTRETDPEPWPYGTWLLSLGVPFFGLAFKLGDSKRQQCNLLLNLLLRKLSSQNLQTPPRNFKPVTLQQCNLFLRKLSNQN